MREVFNLVYAGLVLVYYFLLLVYYFFCGPGGEVIFMKTIYYENTTLKTDKKDSIHF